VKVAKRILIIDDEPKILFVLRHALARFGPQCQVDTYTRSREALKKASRSHYDLVITDLKMPDMDGITLTKILKALNHAPIVIWMTAYDCHSTSEEARRLGVHRCLDKPLEVAEIRRIVSETLWGVRKPLEREIVKDG
jgi:CheY-like chemotaxis protein